MFLTEKMDFLGHLLRPAGLALGAHTNEAIQDLKAARSVVELKMVLGLCNV